MDRVLLELTEEQVMQVTGEVRSCQRDSRQIAFRSIDRIIYELKHRIDATLPSGLKHASSRDGDRFTFIPAPFDMVAEEFLVLLAYARATDGEPNSFLDVGCGIGNIMLIPWSLGIATHGIEYDANILQHCLFPILKGRTRYATGIFHMDALKFRKYSQYDVIYYYCPMCNRKMEDQLESKIQKEMHPGAYLFVPMGGAPRHDKDFSKITRHTWRKED